MRVIATRTLWRLTGASGLNTLARRSFLGQALVLAYHGVVERRSAADQDDSRNIVTGEEFDAQLGLIRRLFTPIAPDDYLAAITRGVPLPRNAAMVTFDDGYRNNLTQAAPLLERHGIPALINVATGHIGTDQILWTDEIVARVTGCPTRMLPFPGNDGPVPVPADRTARLRLAHRIRQRCKDIPDERRRMYIDELRHLSPEPVHADLERNAFLTWDEIRVLSRRGFTIGSHTVDHPILSQVSPDDLLGQLSASRAAVERETGRECVFIAYPNGRPADVPPGIEAFARRTGYCLGFMVTNRFHPVGDGQFTIGRISVPGHAPREAFEARISGVHQYLEQIAARRLRRAVSHAGRQG